MQNLISIIVVCLFLHLPKLPWSAQTAGETKAFTSQCKITSARQWICCDGMRNYDAHRFVCSGCLVLDILWIRWIAAWSHTWTLANATGHIHGCWCCFRRKRRLKKRRLIRECGRKHSRHTLILNPKVRLTGVQADKRLEFWSSLCLAVVVSIHCVDCFKNTITHFYVSA